MAELVADREVHREWPGGYAYRPFQVLPTSKRFTHSNEKLKPDAKGTGSNISALWTPTLQETLIGGVVQGSKRLTSRGGSASCRAKMWKASLELAQGLDDARICLALQADIYAQIKDSELISYRADVKAEVRAKVLKPWICNTGDDDFDLSSLQDCHQKSDNSRRLS
ncbi:MAG: hypothetical protein M1828_005875 [Chrysothrix sp. TS-e1954]|nr:MAG: hypothetical protein M1828_005875 [Chrysothrix sp. TS-e1954]